MQQLYAVFLNRINVPGYVTIKVFCCEKVVDRSMVVGSIVACRSTKLAMAWATVTLVHVQNDGFLGGEGTKSLTFFNADSMFWEKMYKLLEVKTQLPIVRILVNRLTAFDMNVCCITWISSQCAYDVLCLTTVNVIC